MNYRMQHLPRLAVALTLLPALAYAHKDDYLNETFVYRTVDQGELELEYWFDFHQPSEPRDGYYQHTASAEYGFTDKWMADIALNFSNAAFGHTYQLSRWRLETRRRFGEEGMRTPDIAASAELEGEKNAGEWEYQITPRVVLSHDFGEKLNTTLNLFVGVGLNEDANVAPGYNLGIRYPAEGILRVGAEVIQTFDGNVSTSLIPQIWILPLPEDVIKIGYARTYGFGEAYYARVAFEAGL